MGSGAGLKRAVRCCRCWARVLWRWRAQSLGVGYAVQDLNVLRTQAPRRSTTNAPSNVQPYSCPAPGADLSLHPPTRPELRTQAPRRSTTNAPSNIQPYSCPAPGADLSLHPPTRPELNSSTHKLWALHHNLMRPACIAFLSLAPGKAPRTGIGQADGNGRRLQPRRRPGWVPDQTRLQPRCRPGSVPDLSMLAPHPRARRASSSRSCPPSLRSWCTLQVGLVRRERVTDQGVGRAGRVCGRRPCVRAGWCAGLLGRAWGCKCGPSGSPHWGIQRCQALSRLTQEVEHAKALIGLERCAVPACVARTPHSPPLPPPPPATPRVRGLRKAHHRRDRPRAPHDLRLPVPRQHRPHGALRVRQGHGAHQPPAGGGLGRGVGWGGGWDAGLAGVFFRELARPAPNTPCNSLSSERSGGAGIPLPSTPAVSPHELGVRGHRTPTPRLPRPPLPTLPLTARRAGG